MNLLKRAWTVTSRARPSRAVSSRSTLLSLLAAELGRQRRAEAPPLILVDGRSGSGKTRFAEELQRQCPNSTVLHLDDLYPNWDGLADGVQRAGELVAAWSLGESIEFTPTQWPGAAPRERVTLPAHRPLIVEGVGARRCIPAPTSGILPLTVYFDLPSELRRRRALARDGDTFAPYWDSWAAQEEIDLRASPLRQDDPDLLISRDTSSGGHDA